VYLGWLPTGGYVDFTTDAVGWLRYATMLAVVPRDAADRLLTRITRSTMLEVLRQDYIRTARHAPSELKVVKNAMANDDPGDDRGRHHHVGADLGCVVVETVFSVPGIGSSSATRSCGATYPDPGGLLFVASGLMLINILVDLLYARSRPRCASMARASAPMRAMPTWCCRGGA
jgi:peptide/nickel transport system permease protein